MKAPKPNKIFAIVGAFVLNFACQNVVAQQYSTHGGCSPIINGIVGSNVNVACPPPSQPQDPVIAEQQRWQARRNLEEEKIRYRHQNGGCELGTHPVYYPQFRTRLCELND